jgi:hypothetical protein
MGGADATALDGVCQSQGSYISESTAPHNVPRSESQLSNLIPGTENEGETRNSSLGRPLQFYSRPCNVGSFAVPGHDGLQGWHPKKFTDVIDLICETSGIGSVPVESLIDFMESLGKFVSCEGSVTPPTSCEQGRNPYVAWHNLHEDIKELLDLFCRKTVKEGLETADNRIILVIPNALLGEQVVLDFLAKMYPDAKVISDEEAAHMHKVMDHLIYSVETLLVKKTDFDKLLSFKTDQHSNTHPAIKRMHKSDERYVMTDYALGKNCDASTSITEGDKNMDASTSFYDGDKSRMDESLGTFASLTEGEKKECHEGLGIKAGSADSLKQVLGGNDSTRVQLNGVDVSTLAYV